MVLEKKCVRSVLCGSNTESTLKRKILTFSSHHFGVLSDKECSNTEDIIL
jgi:hypothetical protein